MLTYQLDLLNRDGLRSCLCVTECANDRDAVSFALSMLSPRDPRVRVWRGDVMIFDEARSKLPN